MNRNQADRLLNPITWIFLTAAIGFVFDLAFASTNNSPNSPGFDAFSMVLVYIAACWVWNDSSNKKVYFPADLTLIFFWIGLPAYFYETKGLKGILIFVGLLIAYFALAYLWIAAADTIYHFQFE